MSLVLVGDIGGTHARLAVLHLADHRFKAPPATLACRDHADLKSLLDAYLARLPADCTPLDIAVAVAGPVIEGVADFTNLPWRVSEVDLREAGFARASVLNDFEALALAAPRITPADKVAIGSAKARRPGTVAVLGPGTGLGAAAYCVDARGSAVLVTEGGHMGFAPSDAVELEVWRILARRFGRVSLERVLSGPGLLNLHAALGEIEGGRVECNDAAEVVAAAKSGDAAALATVRRFCSILGSAAGDFALAYGAVGGVLIAGGIAPRILNVLAEGGFRAAFERKGRLASYLAAIPTEVVTHPYLALLGAAESLRR
ncbi:glucokinase [Caulobacter sp. S45]|uniref:glucokinase n=1 Tax=Caulobacter sp. S45 TaxID=1641861 RepID=UPI0020C62B54|nr:glucokinase [Caulobacter sp. S45]